LAEKAPEPLSKGSIREEHMEVLLGLVRPPRMMMNLVERHHRIAGGVERGELGQRVVDMLCF
jgi:hypothetical protein